MAPAHEEMLLDFDGWLGRQDDGVRGDVEQHLNAMPEPVRAKEKQRLASMFAVSESTGLDLPTVNERWDMVRGGYAEQQGGDWLAVKDDETAFHGRLVADATQRRDERFLVRGPDDDRDAKAQEARAKSLLFRAQEAAYAGKNYGEALSEWEAEVRGKPGYQDGNASGYAELAAQNHLAMQKTLERVRPVAAEAFHEIARGRGSEAGEGDTMPYAKLRGLEPEEKNLAFRVMSDMAGGVEKGRTQVFFEAAGRSFENMVPGGGAAAWRSRLLRAGFAEGSIVTAADPLAQIREEFGRESMARMSGGTAAGMAPMGGEPRKLNAEEAERWNAEIAAAVEDVDTAEQLRKFGQQVVDPTSNTGGWAFRHLVLPVADSTALLAAFSLPGSTLPAIELSARGYQNDEYLRLREMGMEAREANAIAGVTGAAQAGLDKLEILTLGKFGSAALPNVSRVLRGFAMSGSRAARFGVNAGGTLLAETAIELTQDHVIPALVQDNLASDPRFDVRWGEVWRETAAAAPETMLGMVLLAGIGGAVQTRAQSGAAMRLRGYSLEQIGEIQAAPLAARGDLLAQYLPAKAPEGEAAETLKTEVVELARKEAAVFAEKREVETAATADSLDNAIRVTRAGSGWWVQFGDKSVQVESAEAARRIREDLNQARSEEEAGALVALVDSWHGKAGETTRETTITGNAVTAGEGGVMRNGEVTQEFTGRDFKELQREAEMLAEGGGVFSIDGVNRVSFAEKTAHGARHLVQRLEINQSPSAALTFLHESIEADFRAGLATGGITMDETRRAIFSVSGAFDPAQARDADERAFRERVQRVARGEANETETRETLTELAVADVLGRRRDGAALPAGSVTAALNEAALNATDAASVREIGKVRAFLRAVRQYFRALFGTVAALRRARREGFTEDFDALIEKITGQSEQAAHDRDAAAEAEAITAGTLDYVPPTEEEMAAGIAFRLGRATITPSAETRILPTEGGVLVGPATFSLRAFHGTPHTVDRFSTEKIGTGEGAQAYGWGLYFAENPKVAEEYQKALGGEAVSMEALRAYFTPGAIIEAYGGNRDRVISFNEDAKGAWSVTVQSVQKNAAGEWVNNPAYPRPRTHFTAPSLDEVKKRGLPTELGGNTYTVTLDVEADELLDWDRSLTDQSEKVKVAMRALFKELGAKHDPAAPTATPNANSGGSLYRRIAVVDPIMSKEALSRRLGELGIPGLRYLDERSRGKEGGTRNYVIWDESKIRIEDENGKPVSITPAAPQEGSAAFSLGRKKLRIIHPKDGATLSKKEAINRVMAEFGEGAEPVKFSDGREATINRSKLGKMTAHEGPGGEKKPHVRERILAIQSLRELAAVALELPTHLDDGRDTRVETSHEYFAPFLVGDEVYRARLFVKVYKPEAELGTKLHSLRLEDIEIEESPARQPLSGMPAGLANELGIAGTGESGAVSAASTEGEMTVSELMRGRKDLEGGAFRLSAGAGLELIQKRIDERLARDPEKRRAVAKAAKDKLQKLQYEAETERLTPRGDRIAPIADKRTAAELDKEAAFRQATRREELEAEVYGRYGEVLDNDALTQVWSGPVMSHLANPKDKLHGRLLGKSMALKRQESPDGYDGIDGVPAYVFGGTLGVDEAAQELYEAGLIADAAPDTMWNAIRAEVASAQKFQQFLKAAKADLKAARDLAREEAVGWRRETEKTQKKQWGTRAALARDLRTLDAILSVLPPEVRGKVGGFVKLAQLATPEKRVEEIVRRVGKIDVLLEEYLKKETTAALEELIEKAEPKREAGKQSRGKIGAEAHRFFDQIASVMALDEAGIEGRRAAINAQLADDKTTPAQAADLFEQEQILDAFGAWEKESAADMDAALRAAQEVYTTGRNRWRAAEESRLAEVAGLAGSIVETLGAGTYAGSQKKKKDSRIKAISRGALDLKSFRRFWKRCSGESTHWQNAGGVRRFGPSMRAMTNCATRGGGGGRPSRRPPVSVESMRSGRSGRWATRRV